MNQWKGICQNKLNRLDLTTKFPLYHLDSWGKGGTARAQQFSFPGWTLHLIPNIKCELCYSRTSILGLPWSIIAQGEDVKSSRPLRHNFPLRSSMNSLREHVAQCNKNLKARKARFYRLNIVFLYYCYFVIDQEKAGLHESWELT